MVVSDNWDLYFTDRHGVPMTISFDEYVSANHPPTNLDLCARIIIPIKQCKPNSSWPLDAESELLYSMEDEIVEQLQNYKVSCLLVARMTYDGLRELVFQVSEHDKFRQIVGPWIHNHSEYEIDVSEHDGWSFFNEFVKPTDRDKRNMAEQRVIDNLIDSGSNPELPHTLEYCFQGNPQSLKTLIEALTKKGYRLLENQSTEQGQVVLSISMPLNPYEIREESNANEDLAQQLGVILDGWGASVVTS